MTKQAQEQHDEALARFFASRLAAYRRQEDINELALVKEIERIAEQGGK